MANIGLGAFAQGFAGGLNQGLNRNQNLAMQHQQLKLREKQEERQQAMNLISLGSKLLENKGLPEAQRMGWDYLMEGASRMGMKEPLTTPDFMNTEVQSVFKDWTKFIEEIVSGKRPESDLVTLAPMYIRKIQSLGSETDSITAQMKAADTYLQREKQESNEQSEMQTIYGPEEATKRVPVIKGQEYTPPSGWSLSKPSTAQPRRPNEVDFIAAKLQIDLNKPISKEDAARIIQETTDIKRDRAQNVIMWLLQNIGGIGTDFTDPGVISDAERKELENLRNAM